MDTNSRWTWVGRTGIFYLLTFAFTGILGGIQQLLGIDYQKIVLPQLSPGLAAICMLALFRKDRLKFTVSLKRDQTMRYFGAIGLPLLVATILFLIYREFLGPLNIPSLRIVPLFAMFAGMLIGALGEELGWRGYLLPVLESKWNALTASLLLGLLWGLWHVESYQNGPIYLIFFVLSTLAYSLVIAWLIRGTHYNVTVACLFHFAVNIEFLILQKALTDIRLMVMNGIIWACLAAILVVLRRGDFLSPH